MRDAATKGRPTPDGLIVAEGPHLLREALQSTWRVEQILCTAEARQKFPELLAKAGVAVTEVSARAFASITTTETPVGLLALLRPRGWVWEDVVSGRGLTVVLDAIQDPGNVGAIARSAEAFSASGLILANGCARISNGKVLRAAAGSLFRLPVLEQLPQEEIVVRLRSQKLPVYVLTADGERSLVNANFEIPGVIVIGNEGAGVSPAFLRNSVPIAIPTTVVESLNASIAASVALYEAARQRGVR